MAKKSAKNVLWAGTSSVDRDSEKRYRAEDDLRTLERAKQIMKDKERMREAKKMANEKIKNLKNVCDYDD